MTSIGGSTFSGCSGLTSIAIGNGVSSIGNSAFYSCSNLTSITIPNSVTSIGDYAFYHCYKLVEVYNKSALPISTGNYSYGYVGYYAKAVYVEPYTSKLSVDENGYILYTDGDTVSLMGYTGNETSLILPTGISEIYACAFYCCRSLTSITIPNSATRIGTYAFCACSSLTSITIPDSVTSIDRATFSSCSSLTSITFNGTKAQWNAISKDSDWDYNTGSYTVHCTDGDIQK